MGSIIALAILVLVIYLWAEIIKRMGFSPWISLLILIPIANIFLLYSLKKSPWPLEEKLKYYVDKYGEIPPGHFEDVAKDVEGKRLCSFCGMENEQTALICSHCNRGLK